MVISFKLRVREAFDLSLKRGCFYQAISSTRPIPKHRKTSRYICDNSEGNIKILLLKFFK